MCNLSGTVTLGTFIWNWIWNILNGTFHKPLRPLGSLYVEPLRGTLVWKLLGALKAFNLFVEPSGPGGGSQAGRQPNQPTPLLFGWGPNFLLTLLGESGLKRRLNTKETKHKLDYDRKLFTTCEIQPQVSWQSKPSKRAFSNDVSPKKCFIFSPHSALWTRTISAGCRGLHTTMKPEKCNFGRIPCDEHARSPQKVARALYTCNLRSPHTTSPQRVAYEPPRA